MTPPEPFPENDLPSWEDPALGSMKRVALWLVTVVREGEVFTKEDLRSAFPGISQADRRMRDLRTFGWRIDTNREDGTLDAHEQRFAAAGIPVWEPGKATPPKETAAIGATRRREILARDGYMCRSCGIAAGDPYAGTFESAVLDIARRPVGLQGTVELVTECKRCRVGGRELTADLGGLRQDISKLSPLAQKQLIGWMTQGRRPFEPLEEVWAAYRSLPAPARAELETDLGVRS